MRNHGIFIKIDLIIAKIFYQENVGLTLEILNKLNHICMAPNKPKNRIYLIKYRAIKVLKVLSESSKKRMMLQGRPSSKLFILFPLCLQNISL
jgi:hypothetical protein